MLPINDKQLVRIIDAALADTARRSGAWLVCKPGCTQCCIGAFAINALDAERLRTGMQQLAQADPARAKDVRERAAAYIYRVAQDFPGNVETGILATSPEAEEAFEDFANDEPCPALDPSTGTCDVYAWRPMTCRVFGPPVRSEEGLGVCELCYHGATEEEIATCEMKFDTTELEENLNTEVETAMGAPGNTIVAFALLRNSQ